MSSAVAIQNPNDKGVDVRVVRRRGWLSFTKVNERLHVGASSSGTVQVPKGTYVIRYKFSDSDRVWEGDPFTLEDECVAQITLEATPRGNYGTRPAGGKL